MKRLRSADNSCRMKTDAGVSEPSTESAQVGDHY